MKLAEALILRADAQKRIAELTNRLTRVARIQEGDRLPENPVDLLAELDSTIAELESLIKRINRTNSSTSFADSGTITDAIAERDMLKTKRQALMTLINAATQQQVRYSASEIRIITTVDVAAVQKQADNLARQYRELDAAIQQQNWLVDLVEE